jgi:hypothetical protein
MAMRTNAPGPGSRPPASQQVFTPRESVYKFQSFFPLIVAGLLLAVVTGGGIAFALRAYLPLWWMIPLFMSFPAVSVIAGAVYASRLASSRIVLDADRIRIMQGQRVEANLPWGQISRLTVRKERNEDVFELWVRNQAVRLPVAFFENSEELLQAVSARTRRPWERVRPGAPRA